MISTNIRWFWQFWLPSYKSKYLFWLYWMFLELNEWNELNFAGRFWQFAAAVLPQHRRLRRLLQRRLAHLFQQRRKKVLGFFQILSDSFRFFKKKIIIEIGQMDAGNPTPFGGRDAHHLRRDAVGFAIRRQSKISNEWIKIVFRLVIKSNHVIMCN